MINVLDLFCGCGGISAGFELAGFNIIGGIDFDLDSIRTFQFNFKNSKAICADLMNYHDERMVGDFGKDNIDVIVGGPPCQGFSSANRWQKETNDPRNRLFFEYLRFVEILKPKVVLIENVRGILTRDNGYAKNRILDLLNDLGYNVSSEVLNAADYGVPQKRMRAFFIAVNRDFQNITFNFKDLQKKNQVNVKDAIGELYDLKENNNEIHVLATKPDSEFRKYLRSKSNSILNHEIRYPAELTQKRISYVPQGSNWTSIPKKLFNNSRNNRHSSAYKRLKEDECSVTIDTGNAHSNYFHPLFNRLPTVREAARLQSFKDDFVFQGSRSHQYRQVGNAVPPLLANAIANEIKKLFNDK